MCDFHDHSTLEPLEHDEYVLDTTVVRALVATVKTEIDAAASPEDAVAAIEPHFVELLARTDWLPEQYQQDAPFSGMGGGIGQWLLYRSADRSLCLFSLVVPPGSQTPVHDHGAWGLVGLYRGNQDEEFYRPARPARAVAAASARARRLVRALPPGNDVHRVRTTSAVTSVSIHLLANDTGCVLRHLYDEATGDALRSVRATSTLNARKGSRSSEPSPWRA